MKFCRELGLRTAKNRLLFGVTCVLIWIHEYYFFSAYLLYVKYLYYTLLLFPKCQHYNISEDFSDELGLNFEQQYNAVFTPDTCSPDTIHLYPLSPSTFILY